MNGLNNIQSTPINRSAMVWLDNQLAARSISYLRSQLNGGYFLLIEPNTSLLAGPIIKSWFPYAKPYSTSKSYALFVARCRQLYGSNLKDADELFWRQLVAGIVYGDIDRIESITGFSTAWCIHES